MVASLLTLPRHLRHRVLSSCLTTPTLTLDHLLATFPLAFHTALISSAVDIASGTLTAPPTHQATFFPSLSAASFSMQAPGLLCLKIHPEAPNAANAALVADALAHHSTLTHLQLGIDCGLPPEWIRTLATCLPPTSLPNLKSLTVQVDACMCTAADVSAALGRFTAVQKLAVGLMRAEPQLPGPPLSHYVPSATAPAPLSHLKSLLIIELLSISRSHRQHDTAADTSHGVSESGINLLLPLLSAPALTRLAFASNAAVTSWCQLTHNLQQYSALEVLEMDTDMRSEAGSLSSSPAADIASAPDLVLPALRMLRISSKCAISPLRVVAAISSCARDTLTCLALHHSHEGSGHLVPHMCRNVNGAATTDEDLAAEAGAAWESAMAAIGQCRQLKSLTWSSPSGPAGSRAHDHVYAGSDTGSTGRSDNDDAGAATGRGTESGSRSEALARVLAKLPQLTALSLDAVCEQCWSGGSCAVHGKALAAVLPQLRELQSLNIGAGPGGLVPDMHALLSALPALPALTALEVGNVGVEQAAVEELLPKLAALRDVRLHADVFAGDRNGVERAAELNSFAARFPHVRIVTK